MTTSSTISFPTNETAGPPSNTDPEEYPFWAFIIVECLYLLIYLVIMVAVHKVGILKNDDDAVTIHHKIHGQMIENQEKKFVEEQQKNLANAGP